MRLSVLLPAYNAETTLRSAIESTLAQTYRDFELVLIDDGSTDETHRTMEAFARRDGRVRLIAHARMGMGASLNHAIAHVDSEWVVRMDADDVMMPTRLERQAAFLAANPGLSAASCLVYYINARGQIIAKGNSDLLSPEDFDRYLRTNRLIAVSHPGAVMNRRAVLAIGGYRPQFWPSDDIDLWNRLAETGRPILVQPEYLLKYRIHGASICVAQPRLAMRQIRWVEQCMLARRAGLVEPSLEAFLESERSASWPRRVNRGRTETAQVLYKLAVYHFGVQRYPHMLVAFGGAVLLDPVFVTRRIWSRSVLGWGIDEAPCRRPVKVDGSTGALPPERAQAAGPLGEPMPDVREAPGRHVGR